MDKTQISRFELYAGELEPLFRELIAISIDTPKKLAAEFNRRGVARLNNNRWCGRSIVRALEHAAPELVEAVRRAGRQDRLAKLKQGWDAARQRATTHLIGLLPVLSELIASGVGQPHAIAEELNRRGLRGARGGNWSTRTIERALRHAPELAQSLTRVAWTPVQAAAVRANVKFAHAENQRLANAFAASILPLMRELIAQGFTPHLIAEELNRRGMRGRYGKAWQGATVRKTVQRADPELYAEWSTWCADRMVYRDLRGQRKRCRNNHQRAKQHFAAFRQTFVEIVEPLIAAGHDSAAKLVLELARLGVPTARGGRWDPKTVQRILRREAPHLYRVVRPRSARERSERFAVRLRPLIDELIAAGITQPKAIMAELDRRQVPTQRGGANWAYRSVTGLLRRFGYLAPPKRRYRSLSASDLARQLGVSEDDIYAAARRGELVGIGNGRRLSFSPDTVERALYAAARRRQS
jgi:hypothetical protein